MNFLQRKPIVFFDLETTGVDISKDRIVEIYARKRYPNGVEEEYYQRINPEQEIPEVVAAVHGITNEMVALSPTFSEVAGEIKDFFFGCDIGGYNILRFDIPLLVEEFYRVNIDNPLAGANFLDSMIIFHKMVPRTLAGALQYYTGERLENAHSAQADVIATMQVFDAQIEQHEELPSTAEQIEEFSLNGREIVDFAGYFIKDQSGDVVFNFGKHKNKLALSQPDYLKWMLQNDFPLQTKRVIERIINQPI